MRVQGNYLGCNLISPSCFCLNLHRPLDLNFFVTASQPCMEVRIYAYVIIVVLITTFCLHIIPVVTIDLLVPISRALGTSMLDDACQIKVCI